MSSLSEVKTRRAAPEDHPEVVRLWRHMMDYHHSLDPRFALDRRANEEFAQYLVDIQESFLHAIFVATVGEQIVGYIIVAEMDNPAVFAMKRYGFVCEVCVDPEHTGEGIGHLLFERAFRWFRRRGLTSVQLNVSPRNESGLHFYHQLGFRPFLEVLWKDLEEDKKSK